MTKDRKTGSKVWTEEEVTAQLKYSEELITKIKAEMSESLYQFKLETGKELSEVQAYSKIFWEELGFNEEDAVKAFNHSFASRQRAEENAGGLSSFNPLLPNRSDAQANHESGRASPTMTRGMKTRV